MRERLTAVIVALTAALLAATAFAAPALQLGPATHGFVFRLQGLLRRPQGRLRDHRCLEQIAGICVHVNFAPVLRGAKGAPPQYFVSGRAAAGQIAVFGSEPGESSYNPLLDELVVTWKAGVTPVLLVKDNQITSLAKAGKLTIKDPHIVLNAPITSVGSKATVMSYTG